MLAFLGGQVGQSSVGDGDALGAAGGAGGVDQIRGMLGAQRGGPVGVGDRGGRAGGEVGAHRLGGEDEPRHP
ncbi:hypothetical protein Q8814_25730, partial [Rhodococcus sp. CC-R104]|nr:hypothetical protein [Rhodococcus sp. CC-R104]